MVIQVSLLVRLWVEISEKYLSNILCTSASLWGCELKCPNCGKEHPSSSSASLWGCELKWSCCYWSVNATCQPPCEAVSWNAIAVCKRILVEGQPPCEAVSWNTVIFVSPLAVPASASLWGCELKCITAVCNVEVLRQPPCEAVSWNDHCFRFFLSHSFVSLLVRLWVEIVPKGISVWLRQVSLLVRLWVEMSAHIQTFFCGPSQPPCEAVSWNASIIADSDRFRCQPPCEAVSWNVSTYTDIFLRSQSASLWGCELKCLHHCWFRSLQMSASLWGCELKWKWRTNWLICTRVSLLVRLWVEISKITLFNYYERSASLWGCELKCWNIWRTDGMAWSASLWGCELKYAMNNGMLTGFKSASLWGCELKYSGKERTQSGKRSASLWGCELKCKYWLGTKWWTAVSLLVRLWVEIKNHTQHKTGRYVSLLVRLWVEMYMRCSWLSDVIVSLLVRLWVEIYPICLTSSGNPVSLLVRLWVEILIMNQEIILKIVSLLVRLWVEMLFHQYPQTHLVVSLLVRLWVEMLHRLLQRYRSGSASLWGCELKCLETSLTTCAFRQPPCEAVSWNAVQAADERQQTVSLLVRLWVEIFLLTAVANQAYRQPPCEAVSWNIALSVSKQDQISQPPCEAVSWNIIPMSFSSPFGSSASLWGCELKCCSVFPFFEDLIVSLLVRLWVEMHIYQRHMHGFRCQPPCEAVSWNKVATSDDASIAVSLLVRLWVEMHNQYRCKSSGKLSASLWGCELK